MIKLTRILFATDFSDHANEAKQMAQQLSLQFGAELHLLHVIHDLEIEVPKPGTGLVFPAFVENIGAKRNEMHDKAHRMLKTQVSDDFHDQCKIVFGVRFGKPFREIIRYAREHEVDLIVVGSHGRSGLPHLLLGSVAENVVQMSPCPVLTVRTPKVNRTDEQERDFRGGIHPLPVGL